MNRRLLWVFVVAALTSIPGLLEAQAQFASRTTSNSPGEEYRPIGAILRAGNLPAALATILTVRARAEPLERVLEQIAAQAGLGISYGPDVVQSRTLITLDVTRKSAARALASLERGTPGRFSLRPPAASPSCGGRPSSSSRGRSPAW